jgi:signal transduction histidine kinase
MRRYLTSNPLSWPLVLKAPLLVAVLMFAVSAIITNQVLSRLDWTQQRHLQQLTSAYLDGLSAAVTPAVVRDDVWEVFDNLDRSRTQYRSLNVNWTIVTDANGQVMAASDPVRFPTQSSMPSQSSVSPSLGEVAIDIDRAVAHFSRDITYQGRTLGVIASEADIAPLLKERADVFWTLIATNLALTAVLATIGFALVWRMTRPVALLTRMFESGSKGSLAKVEGGLVAAQSREFRQLFAGYNALVEAQNEREQLSLQLAEEEKVASLGRLASGMAHEINNPLGGMFNAIESLKKHGDRSHVRSTSIRLVESGLMGIRDLVRSTLATYRVERQLRDLSAADLDDLRLLVKPEAKRRNLELQWRIEFSDDVAVPAVPIRDAALNLLLNACHVSQEGGCVGFRSRLIEDHIVLDVSDSGGGLPDHIKEYLNRPGAGSVPLDRRSGLGLWIVKRLCDEMGARLEVISTDSTGTTLRFSVPLRGRELRDAA